MIKWIKGLFAKKSRWTQKRTDSPRRYDCRKNGWGHACSLGDKFDITEKGSPDCGSYYEVSGHLHPRVRPGDEVVKSFEKGPALFAFVKVENCSNPSDMYFATIAYLRHITEKEATQNITDEIRPLTELQQDPAAQELYSKSLKFRQLTGER